MSYDLYFYKLPGNEISTTEISEYLSDNLVAGNQDNAQWFYENPDTEVYFSFDYNEPGGEAETISPGENIVNTNFSFSLNFLRPAFFGLEAFRFVEQFCNDLDLLVSNPQSDPLQTYKPNLQEQFDNWNRTNLRVCRDYFHKGQCCYMSEEACNKVWQYNSNVQAVQNKLGEGYYVSKIFFFREKQTNNAFTLAVWTEHIPIVLPETDYILLTREYKKFFRKIKDTALISRANFLNNFGSYFVDFELPDSKIIHPDKANQVKDKFNAIKSEKKFTEFAERLAIEQLYNAKDD